jgi:hypothetical protein
MICQWKGRVLGGGDPPLFSSSCLTGASEFLYKRNTMFTAILITAMAMCMQMMCMRIPVGVLETSRSLDRH